MKIHIFELRKKEWISEWSSQLYTQLKQLRKESLKKILAWTGFEPMTSAIPAQCSTNWAIKPTGSWSLCEFVIYPLGWWDESEYMKIHTFELRKKEWISEWSSQLYTQLKQLRKESLKKITTYSWRLLCRYLLVQQDPVFRQHPVARHDLQKLTEGNEG